MATAAHALRLVRTRIVVAILAHLALAARVLRVHRCAQAAPRVQAALEAPAVLVGLVKAVVVAPADLADGPAAVVVALAMAEGVPVAANVAGRAVVALLAH